MDIDNLVVISGPPCSGKTTVIEQLKERKFPDLADCLGIVNPSKWNFVEQKNLDKLNGLNIPRLVLEYNFLNLFNITQIYITHTDDWLRILSNSKKITFVTLWTPPQILQTRIRFRKRSKLRGAIFSGRVFNIFKVSQKKAALNRLHKLEKFYNASKQESYYDRWFEFCARFDAKANWILESDGCHPSLFEQSKWLEDRKLDCQQH